VTEAQVFRLDHVIGEIWAAWEAGLEMAVAGGDDLEG
jgi:hypothetical protein